MTQTNIFYIFRCTTWSCCAIITTIKKIHISIIAHGYYFLLVCFMRTPKYLPA